MSLTFRFPPVKQNACFVLFVAFSGGMALSHIACREVSIDQRKAPNTYYCDADVIVFQEKTASFLGQNDTYKT